MDWNLVVGAVGVEPTQTYLYAGRLQRLELANAQYSQKSGGHGRNRTYSPRGNGFTIAPDFADASVSPPRLSYFAACPIFVRGDNLLIGSRQLVPS